MHRRLEGEADAMQGKRGAAEAIDSHSTASDSFGCIVKVTLKPRISFEAMTMCSAG